MTRLSATHCEFDVALTLQRGWEAENPPSAFAGSSHWCRAAAKVLTPDPFVPIVFQDEHEKPVGVAMLTTGTTGWRSGSPGKTTMRWPFQEFGYHFAPTWDPENEDLRRDWVVALWELFPDGFFELERCAPVTRARPDTLSAGEGPVTWSLAVHDGLRVWQSTLKGDHRRDLEYYRRRIAKSDGVWLDSDLGHNLDDALAQCFDLHERRVQSKGKTSAYLTEHGRAFLRALVTIDPSSVRISRLSLDDRIVGSTLSFVHHGHFRCFMPGWDPTERKLDLGRQMIYHQILNEFERELTTIDLLGGDLSYKREFGLTPLPTTNLVTNPTRGAAARKRLVDGALRMYRRITSS